MNATNDVVTQGLRAVAFGALLWLSLAATVQVAQWAPDGPMMHSARMVVLILAIATTIMSAFGATAGLMAVLGLRAPKDAAPKP